MRPPGESCASSACGTARAAVLLVFLAACSTTQRPAPVVDRKQPARAPAPAAKPAPAAAAEGTYVVKKGDTLYSIALENGAAFSSPA